MKRSLSRWGLIGLAVFVLLGIAAANWYFRPPVTPEQIFAEGLAAADRGDWGEVLDCAERLSSLKDLASEQSLLRGIYWVKSNRPDLALKELGRLEPAGAIRESALLTAGEALYRMNRLAEAERLFATVASEYTGHREAHRWLGAIAYDLGDMNRVMDETSIVIRLAPQDYRPHLLRAQIHADMEQYRDAIDEYTELLALQPPQGVLDEALPELIRAQMRVRDYAAALQTLKSAQHSSAITLALEAECHLSLGDETAARTRLDEARKMNPEDPSVLRLLGRIELDAGHPEAAIEPLRSVISSDPQDHESRLHLSQALRLLGKVTEADEEASRSRQIIELKSQLAERTVFSISHPLDSEVRDRMALICEELGKPQLAASWRRAAAVCRERSKLPDASAIIREGSPSRAMP